MLPLEDNAGDLDVSQSESFGFPGKRTVKGDENRKGKRNQRTEANIRRPRGRELIKQEV